MKKLDFSSDPPRIHAAWGLDSDEGPEGAPRLIALRAKVAEGRLRGGRCR